MVERMLADVEHAHGMRWSALRYFNASGADPEGGLGECHEPEIHLIPVALEAAAALGRSSRSTAAIGRSNGEVMTRAARVIWRPAPHEEAPRRPGDPPTLVADISRFKRDFGWQSAPRGSRHDRPHGLELVAELEAASLKSERR